MALIGGSGGVGGGQLDEERTYGGYPVNRKPYKGAEHGDMYRLSPRGSVPVSQRDLKPSGRTFTYGGVIVPARDKEATGTQYVGYDDPSLGTYVSNRFGSGMVPMSGVRSQAGERNTWNAIDDMKKRYESDAQGLRGLQKTLARKGMLTKQAITGAWNETTEKALAALMVVGNRNGRSWDQVLAGDTAGEGVTDLSGGGSGKQPQPFTTTDTRVDHNPRKTVIQTVKDVMQAELGRAPTVSEIDDFVKGLRGYERANPTVSTTSVEYVPDNNGGWAEQTDTTVSGGVDSTEMSAYLQDFGDDYRPKEERRYKRGIYVDQLMQLLGVDQ